MPAVNAAGHAGFGDDDFLEERKFGTEALPNPGGEVFAGGIVEAGDFVEVVVIEAVKDGLESGGDVGVVHEPAEFGVAWARDDNFDNEAVAVEPAAFVGLGEVGQQVRGLELK